MAQPTWIGSGTVPKNADTRRILLAKKVGAAQNVAGASAQAANHPKRKDTLYRLRWKLVKATKTI